MDLIELRDIYKAYNLGEVDVPVLKGVSLNVRQGELVSGLIGLAVFARGKFKK